MENVALTLRLDLKCPGCGTVGTDLRIEIPREPIQSALLVVSGDYDAEKWKLATPARLSCSNKECGRSINYGPVPGTLEIVKEEPNG